MAKFAVMRAAVIMEDEGREFFIRSFSTRKEAEDWIKAQAGEYFKPGDYYVAEAGNS